jgi:hypothetical protein
VRAMRYAHVASLVGFADARDGLFSTGLRPYAASPPPRARHARALAGCFEHPAMSRGLPPGMRMSRRARWRVKRSPELTASAGDQYGHPMMLRDAFRPDIHDRGSRVVRAPRREAPAIAEDLFDRPDVRAHGADPAGMLVR